MAPLPDWLEPLPDAEQMRATDRWAIEEQGVPGLKLMERAGEGLAELVDHVAPTGRVVIVCGGGNNGGDGFVAARLLRQAGRDVGVFVTSDLGVLQGRRERPTSTSCASRRAVRGRGAGRRGGRGRLPARHRLLRRRPRARALGDPRAERLRGRRSWRATCRAASTPRRARSTTSRSRRAAPPRSTAPSPGCGSRRASSTRATCTSIEIGIPPGEPIEPDVGLIGDGAFDVDARAARRTRRSSRAGTCSWSAARPG